MLGRHSPESAAPGGGPNAPRAYLVNADISGVRSSTAGSSLAGSGQGCRLVPTWCWAPCLSAATQNRRRNGGPVKNTHGGNAAVPDRGRDRGTTFVEILVSIVLLGTAVGGTLTALRATVVSGERDNGQAEAQAWLLVAEDALYRTPYYSCADPGPGEDGLPGMDEGDILFEYERAVSLAPRPPGWGSATIQIPILRFWQKSDGVELWDPACPVDSSPIRQSAQLVDVYVLSPDGAVGKTIQVVKSVG